MQENRQDSMKVACIQMCSGRDVDRNIADASQQIRTAAAHGAGFILTPEMTNLLDENKQNLYAKVSPMDDDRAVKAFAELAASLDIHLLIGSLALQSGDGKLVNRSILFLPDGSIGAWYDKIHMFDVDLGEGEFYRESANYNAGEKAVTTPLAWGTLGMSICYDVRFAHLYRQMAQGGAQFLSVPAAFTRPSGQAHWHVLLRARAIETGCFVFAPAQTGAHENGRQTFGHSLIISPWGEILAEAGETPEIIYADIDVQKVDEARGKIPALQHDRAFSLKHITIKGIQ